MSKKFKVTAAICLSLCIALGCVGCTTSKDADEIAKEGIFNENGYPIVSEKITLTMMGPKTSMQAAWKDMDVFQILEEKTNIAFDFKEVDQSTYTEKKNLAFASNSLPDVFFGSGSLTIDDEEELGTQGSLIAMDDYILKYAPNIAAIFEKNPDIKAAVTSLNGNIYSLPYGSDLRMNLANKTWINKSWLDAIGEEVPRTTDELYDVLKAFKGTDLNGNGENDELPISFVGSFNNLISAFGYVTDDVDVVNGKLVYVPIQEGYREYLVFMNKLYTEGLIDIESYSQTSQQLTAKGNKLMVGCFEAAGPFLLVPEENNSDYVALPPLTSSVNDTPVWKKSAEFKNIAFTMTKNNLYPEATMRWADYLYSEEGMMLMHNGVEGKHWQWTDDNKTSWERIAPEGMNTEEWRAQATPNCGTGTPEIWPQSLAEKQAGDLNAYIRNAVDTTYVPYWREALPTMRYTNEEIDLRASLNTDIYNYMTQMTAKFITGQESLDKWDSYVKQIKDMGIDELMAMYEKAYARYIENRK